MIYIEKKKENWLIPQRFLSIKKASGGKKDTLQSIWILHLLSIIFTSTRYVIRTHFFFFYVTRLRVTISRWKRIYGVELKWLQIKSEIVIWSFEILFFLNRFEGNICRRQIKNFNQTNKRTNYRTCLHACDVTCAQRTHVIAAFIAFELTINTWRMNGAVEISF